MHNHKFLHCLVKTEKEIRDAEDELEDKKENSFIFTN